MGTSSAMDIGPLLRSGAELAAVAAEVVLIKAAAAVQV